MEEKEKKLPPDYLVDEFMDQQLISLNRELKNKEVKKNV